MEFKLKGQEQVLTRFKRANNIVDKDDEDGDFQSTLSDKEREKIAMLEEFKWENSFNIHVHEDQF